MAPLNVSLAPHRCTTKERLGSLTQRNNVSIQCKHNPIVFIHFRHTIIAQYNNPSDDISEFLPTDNQSSHPIEEAACLKSLLVWEVQSVADPRQSVKLPTLPVNGVIVILIKFVHPLHWQ